ncbi:outer membrane protein assembly factor BamB [Thalassotalea sp. G20_0]|uniref:outer membrane protein assembly factor BamB n=1 Tax=Thalassotalea sp. G20_0 TaxID=2821093 RepID=UPI001ADC5327|nr:outer membrane protein assembly factor BamB [Thalassotalea sp. G20_0]MBO9492675.1 outer membrane protein assembly factor BamB [Thalassotalea sp. G20_0]
MERLFKGSLILLLMLGLSACSLFSSDEEEVRTAKPLQTITEEKVRLVEVWSRGVGKGVGKRFESLKPALDGDKVFVSGAEGTVFALERDTGKEVWKKKLNTRVGGGVSAAAGMVLLGTLDGEVIALNQENGDELWRERVSSEILSAPVTDGFYVAVQSIDDRLTVLDAESGQYLWRQEALQPALTLRGSAAPLIFSEAVFAGFASGEAKAFRLKNGAPLWSSRVAAPKGSTELERMVDIKGAPLILGDSIFFVSFQGNVAGLDLYSGRVRWAKELSSYESMTEGFGAIYLTSEESYVSSIDQRTGAANWRQEDFEFRQLSAPAAFSSYVVVGDGEGYVHLLSQVDGSQAGRFKADSSAIKAQPLVDGDLILVLSADGELVALKEKASG